MSPARGTREIKAKRLPLTYTDEPETVTLYLSDEGTDEEWMQLAVEGTIYRVRREDLERAVGHGCVG